MHWRHRERLSAQVTAHVRQILTECNLAYLTSLDHARLLAAIEDELGFLGLWHRDDQETPAVVHALVETQLTAWVRCYLRPRVGAAALIQPVTTAAVGIVATGHDSSAGGSPGGREDNV